MNELNRYDEFWKYYTKFHLSSEAFLLYNTLLYIEKTQNGKSTLYLDEKYLKKLSNLEGMHYKNAFHDLMKRNMVNYYPLNKRNIDMYILTEPGRWYSWI